MGNYSILNILAEYGLSMIDLVLTQPTLGPPWPLATLCYPWQPFGDDWRPLKMPENCDFGGNDHFGKDQNVSLEMISVHQTIKGDPRLVSNLLLKETRLTLCFFDWLGKFVHNNKQFDLRASSKYCQTFFQGTVRCSSGGKVQSCFAFYLELTKDEKQTNTGNFPQKKNSPIISQKLCQLASHAWGMIIFVQKK